VKRKAILSHRYARQVKGTTTKDTKDHDAMIYNKACMISQDLLDMLVCPVCKKPVVLSANGESLKCGECRRVYPIQDDIPIMLVDAAKIDAA
jgi:uncharacterized protein YbaR (Trm112 family)